MAKHEETVYTCDGCKKRFLEREPGIEGPNGFHGTVYLIHEGGATGEVKWFADVRGCILQAVLNALEEEGCG